MQGEASAAADTREEFCCSSESLLPVVYEELRRLAAARMKQEPAGHTLQATALVHEAWLQLAEKENFWGDRAHFFGAASQAMRQILIHHARRKAALKRQPDPNQARPDPKPENHVLLIHDSLSRLEKDDPDAAEIVLLKFFYGLSSKEIAATTRTSIRSVERRWALAKAKLYQIIRQETHRENDPPA